jgi:hypothetical protein
MANVNISIYGGKIDVNYDCSGAAKCDFALWEEMPIKDNEHCISRYCGSCRSQSAQLDALQRAKRRLSEMIKTIESEE